MAGTLVDVPERFVSQFEDYESALSESTLRLQARRAYSSRVRSYLAWLDSHTPDSGDPLADPRARDAAVAAYRDWLLTAGKAPNTVNAHLVAIDGFYVRLGLGAALVNHDVVIRTRPRVLGTQERRRYLQAVRGRALARDRAIGYLLYCAGPQLDELVAFDMGDVRLPGVGSASVTVRDDDGSVQREIPLLDRAAVAALEEWVAERAGWPGAGDNPALFLNQRDRGRLSTRAVAQIVEALMKEAGIVLADGSAAASAQVIRQTYGADLLGRGADIAAVAALMGHKNLETTRALAPDAPARDLARAAAKLPAAR